MSEPKYILKRCPFCGNNLNMQDQRDTIYPVGRLDDLFQLVCQVHAGGCDASVLGKTPLECVKKWNTRVPFYLKIKGKLEELVCWLASY